MEQLNRLDKEQKAVILKTTILFNCWNALTYAATYAHEQLGILVDAINGLEYEDKAQIYKFAGWQGWSALLIAARNTPEQLGIVIDTINGLKDADKAQIYKQTINNGCSFNVVMLVARHAPEQLDAVIEAINSLSEEDRTAILMHTIESSWDVFAVLAVHFPEILSTLSNKIPESLQLSLLSHRIKEAADVELQKELKNENTLQLLLKRNSIEGLNAVLNVVSFWEITNQESLLTSLNNDNENALLLALPHSQMLSLVLDRVKNFSPDVIAQLFLQKDKQGIDVLTKLLTHYPNQVQMVLDFITDLPQETQTLILRGHEKALVEIATNQVLNKHSRDSLSTTMELVLKFPPEILTKLHNAKVFPKLSNPVKDAGRRRILLKTDIDCAIKILDKKIAERYPQEGSTETPQVVSAYEEMKRCWQQYIDNKDKAQEPRLKKEVLSAMKKTESLVSDLDYDAKNLLEAILEAIYSVILWLFRAETKHEKIFQQLNNSMNQYSPPFFTAPGKTEQELTNGIIPSAPESTDESDEGREPGLPS